MGQKCSSALANRGAKFIELLDNKREKSTRIGYLEPQSLSFRGAIPSGSYRAQNPPKAGNTNKKKLNPPAWVGPQKYRIKTKMARKIPFLRLFGFFCVFIVFSFGSPALWVLVAPDGIAPLEPIFSREKRNPNPNFLVRIFAGGVGGLPSEGVGAKKFGMSFETQGNQTFWRDILGFCRDILGVPEKFEKKSLCSMLVPICHFFRVVQTLFLENGVLSPTENRWF